MIVRDSARTLEPCLRSVRPWVDEIVVVDTGSIDDTPQIAAQFGARVSVFPWCDDFSAARNESLRRADGKWLFWMDSDDTISEENGQRIQTLAYAEHPTEILGFVMQVHCPHGRNDDGDDLGMTIVDHVKLFRNHPQLRFEFRIHEQILPAINRLGGRVAWTNIFVVHSGADCSPDGRQRKYERDMRILRQELAERPDHPFALFNLGMTHNDMGEHEQAVASLRRCLEVSEPHESHVRKAYALLVSSLVELGELEEAWSVCLAGRRTYKNDTELLFRQALVAHRLGRLDEAERLYLGSLTQVDERHYSSVDSGLASYRARHNLAVVYRDMGLPAMEEMQWRRLLFERPGYQAGRIGLVRSLLAQGKFNAAKIEIERLSHDGRDCDRLLLHAELAEASRDLSAARERYENAVCQWPERSETWSALCRFLLSYEGGKEAEEWLQRWVEHHPAAQIYAGHLRRCVQGAAGAATSDASGR